MTKNDKWEIVENIDYSRRKPLDWAAIYKVKLLNEPLDNERLWSEFEWAYYFCRTDYSSLDGDFETLAEFEMRAIELNRDLYMGASIGEKEILKERYVETEWCRKRLNIL